MEHFALEFGAGRNGLQYVRDGWADPERDFCWMVGLESTMVIPQPPPAVRYRLSLSVQPHVREDKLPRQILICLINNVCVGLAELTDEASLEWEAPRFAFEVDDAVNIRLIHPNAASPREVAEIPDDRRLAIAIKQLTLTSFTISKFVPEVQLKGEVEATTPPVVATPPGPRPSAPTFHRLRGQPPNLLR